MLQSGQKPQKQKRQRANSQSLTPQQRSDSGGGSSSSGGGGSVRKNGKSHNVVVQSISSPFCGTKVYSNSNRTADLQSLLTNFSSQSPLSTNPGLYDNTKFNGATNSNKKRANENIGDYGCGFVNPLQISTSTNRTGYAGAVISGGLCAAAVQPKKNVVQVTAAVKRTGPTVINEDESNRLNSTALRRIDAAFSKLHGTASQVAVYRYNPATQSWDKTDTVGCLFLYERNASPIYGLVVMNRKNANNFIQCFGPDGQVVLHMPYLLLRAVEDLNKDPTDGSQVIHCIWFYDAQDCVAMANILRNMGLQFEGEGFGLQAPPTNPGLLSGNTLFQILQRKKQSPLPQTPNLKEKTVPRVLTAEELESQMLHESDHFVKSNVEDRQDFLSKFVGARGNGELLQSSPGLMMNTPSKLSIHTPGEGSVFQQFLNMSLSDKQGDNIRSHQHLEAVTPEAASSPCNPTVVTLGSQNKMRTVEQLERDMKRERSSDSSSSASAAAIQNELMQTLGIPNSSGTDCEDPGTPSEVMDNTLDSSVLDNIIGKCVEETDPEELRRAVQSIEPPNQLILVTEAIPGASESRLTWRINRSSSVKKENDSTFTTPTGEFLSATGTRCSSQLGLGADAKYFDLSLRSLDMKPTPLTKDQLHQALMYLIQNDPDFINKIHDAYVKSLQQAFDVRHF